MSIQDDMYDVADAVKGTDAEEAFDRFSKWAGQNEADLDLVLARYNVIANALKLIKTFEEINAELDDVEQVKEALLRG